MYSHLIYKLSKVTVRDRHGPHKQADSATNGCWTAPVACRYKLALQGRNLQVFLQSKVPKFQAKPPYEETDFTFYKFLVVYIGNHYFLSLTGINLSIAERTQSLLRVEL